MNRTIRPEDALQIKAICEASLGYETSIEIIEKQIAALARDDHYLIAVYEDEADGRVKGFIEAERYAVLYGDTGWNIIALAVAPEAQGRGIGKALTGEVEARAREEGCAFVRLNSRIEREKAHGFYAHLGYQGDKTQKRFLKKL